MQNEDLFDYSNATVEEIMVHVSGKPLAELQQIPFYKEAYDRTAILYGKTTYEKLAERSHYKAKTKVREDKKGIDIYIRGLGPAEISVFDNLRNIVGAVRAEHECWEGDVYYISEEGHKELVKMYEDIAEHATA